MQKILMILGLTLMLEAVLISPLGCGAEDSPPDSGTTDAPIVVPAARPDATAYDQCVDSCYDAGLKQPSTAFDKCVGAC